MFASELQQAHWFSSFKFSWMTASFCSLRILVSRVYHAWFFLWFGCADACYTFVWPDGRIFAILIQLECDFSFGFALHVDAMTAYTCCDSAGLWLCSPVNVCTCVFEHMLSIVDNFLGVITMCIYVLWLGKFMVVFTCICLHLCFETHVISSGQFSFDCKCCLNCYVSEWLSLLFSVWNYAQNCCTFVSKTILGMFELKWLLGFNVFFKGFHLLLDLRLMNCNFTLHRSWKNSAKLLYF